MESPKAGYMRNQNEEESGVGKREVALSGGRGDDSREERQDAEGRDDPKGSSSSLMLGLLEEFTQIYSDRLQRVEQAAMKCDEKQYLQNKVCILESWVRDLGEQNAVLVTTVEELEREAAERVSLLEDRLAKMATTTRESCVSLRDHQIQMSSLVTDKIGLENEAKGLSEKMLTIERKNICLKEENSNLQSDLNNLVQVITRARQTGQWETDDLTFSCVTPEQVFGPVLSSSRRSSQSLKESQQDYFRQVLEGQFKKDNSSIASSFSNLQDADSSVYGGRGSEKDLIIMKLKADLRNLQTTHEETSQQLLERDKQIADLQSQLMEVHHELAVSQAEVTNISHTLQEVRHRNRHENVEVTRKEEVIRHLLSKQSSFKKDSVKGSSPSLCELDTVITGENNVEAQLSENIDVLASRLAELEEECQQLQNEHRALQDIHALCTPTINMLQEQLNRSHQTQVELRTVLTAEVAQRHDQLVNLRDELKDQEQKHHETRMQLQLKTHVIKDLRKEVRDLKERQLATDDKNALTPLKDGLCNGMKGTISAETQTCEIFANKTGSSAEETTQTSSSGFYSPASQTPHISKLENELAEKNILLRELQSHLAASRQELHLKDETLYKLEQKLESSRRDGGQKGERMQYLTGQLTSLQLEVGRTHGQAEQLRRQVEKKTELVEKLETENSSLTQQLNEKSATLERFQTEILKISSELEKKKKEVTEQRMTIRTLQEALVASKRSCDDLRSRLDNDVCTRESETERLEQDLKEAQTMHHRTFTQLVESGARGEVLQEENRALSRRVATLQDELKHAHKQEARQTHYWKAQAEEATSKMTKAQKEMQTLEEELSAATKAKVEAERRAAEMLRKNLQLEERLSALETSESVERLGEQLEEAVAALTAAREEARIKGEQFRRAQQDTKQLSDALGYEKELNTTLHNQVEGLIKETEKQEQKVGDLQQEVRRLTRDTLQKERQVTTLQSELEGVRNQVATMEELLDEEQREVGVLNDSLAHETKLLHQTRMNLDVIRKEAVQGEEQVAGLKRDLQEVQEKNSCLERRVREMENEREAEVAAVAERLTVAHEESVRRLEDTLLTYTRIQAHDEFQVETLEDSLTDLGGRLAESELRLKETQMERDTLCRNLQQEHSRREEDAQEHQRQILRLTEENSLLKARMESVQEETITWQRHCEDLEERHCHVDNNNNLQVQLAKAQHQVETLRDAIESAKAEKQAAEEERGHAHEQVLSLIRECNALEEQIHRLTKEKCRLQEQLSGREADLTMTRDSAKAVKDELAFKAEQVAKLEKELEVAKLGDRSLQEEVQVLGEEVRSLQPQLKEAQAEVRRLNAQLNINNLEGQGMQGQVILEPALSQQLRSEVAMVRREASEARRALLERDTQAKMTQLKITTLQRSLQDHQHEVSGLEGRLLEAQTEAHRMESEASHLRTKVAMLSTQLAHAHKHNMYPQSHTDKMEVLESEVSRLKGELSAKEEQLKQAGEREARETRRAQDLQQDMARLTKTRDEALRKALNMEASLGETLESVEGTKIMEKLWEAQLASIEEEMARLLCESNQLKDCNAALHDQLSASQSEGERLRGQVRMRETQLEELQQARDLLANDAQVVVAAVKQWLHEQKATNTKLASKLHQQNKQILLLNTEKQFLAERNTTLQRSNHDLSLQVHDLRTRIGLPLTTSPPEKLGKVGGVLVGGLVSPRVLSPTMGVSSRVLSATPSLDSVLGLPAPTDIKHEDVQSTCSSEGSSAGCQVPGPDLPGVAQLERLAFLADSLFQASSFMQALSYRSITRASGGPFRCHSSSKMTSATSLGDLTSTSTWSHIRSTFGHSKKTSSSVGNLTTLCPEMKDKATSPITKLSLLTPGSKAAGRVNEVILAAPVRERKSSHRLFNNHSIEEADEEEVSSIHSSSTMSASRGSSFTPPMVHTTTTTAAQTTPPSDKLATHTTRMNREASI
ncbi:uncharacterized protein [Panulirus ornatus]|uniref:uncharacterized protein isoform X2 n=1 Tax=Panulirus ornatus TaxID=150431 RepID=UPI003A8BF6B9